MNFLLKALAALTPTAPFEVEDTYDSLVWKSEDIAKPTQQEVETKIAELQAEYDAQAYARARTYPSIGDQLDMIFHAGLGGDEFQAAIQAVKDANPKPE